MNKLVLKVNRNNMPNIVLEKENAPRRGHLQDHLELSLSYVVSQPLKETTHFSSKLSRNKRRRRKEFNKPKEVFTPNQRRFLHLTKGGLTNLRKFFHA